MKAICSIRSFHDEIPLLPPSCFGIEMCIKSPKKTKTKKLKKLVISLQRASSHILQSECLETQQNQARFGRASEIRQGQQKCLRQTLSHL
jgi:hypothetical protein